MIMIVKYRRKVMLAASLVLLGLIMAACDPLDPTTQDDIFHSIICMWSGHCG
jgi:hypothetical protein